MHYSEVGNIMIMSSDSEDSYSSNSVHGLKKNFKVQSFTPSTPPPTSVNYRTAKRRKGIPHRAPMGGLVIEYQKVSNFWLFAIMPLIYFTSKCNFLSAVSPVPTYVSFLLKKAGAGSVSFSVPYLLIAFVYMGKFQQKWEKRLRKQKKIRHL